MPPYWIAMASAWFQFRHVPRRTRRVLGLTAAFVMLVSVLPYFLHFGPGPAWLGELAGDWAADQGIHLKVESVRLRGWGEAIVDGVEVASGLEAYGLHEVEAERLLVRFDWRPLLVGERPRIGAVRIEEPRVAYRVAPERPVEESVPPESPAVPADGGKAGGGAMVWEHPIAVEVRDGLVAVQGTPVEALATLSLQGTLSSEGLTLSEVQMELAGDAVRGRLEGEGEIRWQEGALTADGEWRGEALQLALAGDVYRIDRAQGELAYDPEGWAIPELVLERADGRVELTGAIGEGGAYEFVVTATDLEVAEALPVLERLGFAGEATFAGTLAGVGWDAVLHGDATLGSGRVWGRPQQSTVGRITLSAERLDLHEVQIRQRVGLYDLEGFYAFPAGEAAPGRLDLWVAAHGGQVEDLLAVLGADALPLSGRLDGRLRFAGPLGDVTGGGEVTAADVTAWGQPFDRVTADFTWADGRVSVARAEAELGPGRLHLHGEMALDGSDVDFRFDAEAWSLGETLMVSDWSEGIGGQVDLRLGRLTGSMETPLLTAEIASETLRIGTTAFHGVQGAVRISEHSIALESLRGIRSGGGVYTLEGTVDRTAAGELTTQVTVAVSDESLSRLLRLAGQELPALLLDGNVSGRIDVSGPVEQPDAQLDLTWERGAAGDRDVELVLRLADGSVEVERFEY